MNNSKAMHTKTSLAAILFLFASHLWSPPPPLPPAVLGQPWAGHRAYSCQKHQTGFITNEPA